MSYQLKQCAHFSTSSRMSALISWILSRGLHAACMQAQAVQRRRGRDVELIAPGAAEGEVADLLGHRDAGEPGAVRVEHLHAARAAGVDPAAGVHAEAVREARLHDREDARTRQRA